MKNRMPSALLLLFVLSAGVVLPAEPERDFRLHQYHYGDIAIPPASADEPVADRLSVAKAGTYLDDGAKAWAADRGCVSCHTTGWYGILRPQLSSTLGAPDLAFRKFLSRVLDETLTEERNKTARGTGPAQAIYLAASLASWDAHVAKKLSLETERALELMFSVQQDDGSFASVQTWPPFESDTYQLATVAAMAVGLAPGWVDEHRSDELGEGVARLRGYLKTTDPPHDYGRVALLWASRYLPGLLDSETKDAITKTVLDQQRPDGGWSLRSFGEPEQWGIGNRSERLRAEADFDSPPSDGHQTGLSIIVLREAGIPPTHPAIQRGLAWLKQNQRQSGRWWTKSLNTDKWNFITFTGTLYPVMALTMNDPESSGSHITQ